MFGVVLWSDIQAQKAVIWCEDHGELAFYRRAEQGGPIQMDAGDLVQFELALERNQRLARNPRLIAEGVYCELAGSLNASVREHPQRHANAAQLNRGSAEIIPFAQQACNARTGRDRDSVKNLA